MDTFPHGATRIYGLRSLCNKVYENNLNKRAEGITMHTPVSVQDKKDFIKWFISNYRLKKRESVWILNYLIRHDDILSNIHFVRDINNCPRAIVMSSYCSAEVSFCFYKRQIITDDTDKTFHDIRLNRREALFIQLNFNKSYQCPYYAAILEESPFTPTTSKQKQEDQWMADHLLEKLLLDYKINALKKEIDLALDEFDHSIFLKLVDKLHRLE